MRWLIAVIIILINLLSGFFIGWTVRENIHPYELISPSDHIMPGQVHAYDGRIIIDGDFTTAVYSNTNSMDPVIDETSMGIEMSVGNLSDIKPGDIISYRLDKDRIIVHRVISIEEDGKGPYLITKGDNNQGIDPVKVRPENIVGILVGVLY